MRLQRVIFTALPQGFEATPQGRVLRMLALVSPRLYTDEGLPIAHLGQFPDFVDWPATKIAWSVQFENQVPVPASVTSPMPGSAAWEAVFSPESYVEPYKYQSFSGRVTRSFPHAVVRQFVFDLYGSIARASPLAFPTRQALVAPPGGPRGHLDPIAFGPSRGANGKVTDTETQALGAIDGFLGAHLAARSADLGAIADATSGAAGPTGIALLQVKRFLQARTPGPASGKYSDVEPVPAPAPPGTMTPAHKLAPNILDFHQVVSAMSDHGGLLRALGLVVELVVAVPAGPVPSTARLVPTWVPKLEGNPPASGTIDVTPYTILDPSGWPAPRMGQTRVSAGRLRFDLKSDFTPIEVDTEGGGLKLLDLARTLRAIEVDGTATPGTSPVSSIPSLRQVGIAVAQLDRAWALSNPSTGLLGNGDSMNAGAEATPAVNPTVGVEDLARGIRVDIYDETRKRWFQLCARSAPNAYGDREAPAGYLLGSGGSEVTVAVPEGDEGFVSTVATSDSTPGGDDDLYLQESLFLWNGWSLVGSRPGKTLGEPPHLPVTDQPRNEPAPGTGFPVEIDYVATPGTLPLLRFGRSYRVRARVADLAGGGPGFEAAASPESFQFATSSITYGRFQPVPPPVMLMRNPVSEGERLDRLVIRSNYDIPDDPPGSSDPHITPCVRHVVAPATAELLAEQHGMFDHLAGLDAAAYNLIKERANAAIGEVATNRTTEDPHLPSQHGRGSTSGVYYDTDQLYVPYLPDVLARAAVFTGLPATSPGEVVRASFSPHDESWPASQPFRLRLVGEGSRKPLLADAGNGHTLTVSLPKAAIVEVQRASAFNLSDLSVVGLWEWFGQQGIASAALKRAVLDGLVWLLTPPRAMTLVHAVRQPLRPPSLSSRFAVGQRSLHETTAVLHDPAMSFDRASSGKIDVGAQWQEWVDNGKNANPELPVPTAARAGEVALSASGADHQDVTLTQHFNDTRGRLVDYSLTATTRFAEYFVERVVLELRDAPATIDHRGVMAGSVVVSGTYQGKDHTFLAGEDYTTDDAAGTIERLPSGKISSHRELHVSFVPLPVTRSSLEGHRKGYLGVSRAVPSTARPAAPDVLYTLPAWSFSGPQRRGQSLRSRRLGGALRVYLRRPWWSSGGGEQLGVVLADPTGDSVAPYYSQWGADPLWKAYSLSSTGAPTTADFPLAVSTLEGGITLDEATGTYGIAAHQVHFDKDRGLWSCDIQLATDLAYFPFVRLALARYQPNSIESASTSRVIVADCSQTVPTRSTVVDLSVSGVVSVTVTGAWYLAGAAPGGSPGPNGETGYMYAQIEKQAPGLRDELSWMAVDGESALTATANFGSTGLTTWTGSLRRPKGDGTYRLAVWEQQGWPTTGAPHGPVAPRVVFFDAIPI